MLEPHNSWVEKIPWRKKWQTTPVFLPGRSHGCKRVGHDLRKIKFKKVKMKMQIAVRGLLWLLLLKIQLEVLLSVLFSFSLVFFYQNALVSFCLPHHPVAWGIFLKNANLSLSQRQHPFNGCCCAVDRQTDQGSQSFACSIPCLLPYLHPEPLSSLRSFQPSSSAYKSLDTASPFQSQFPHSGRFFSPFFTWLNPSGHQ